MKKVIHVFAVVSVFVLTVLAAAVPTQAAAKTQSVYVLTRMKTGGGDTPTTYKYNKNGLLKSYTRGVIRGEYKYNSKQQITRYRRQINEWANFDYTYNKKGNITSIKGYYTYPSNGKFAYDGLKTTYTYNKKGQITKEVTKGKQWDDSTEKEGNVTYTFTCKYNGKGLLTQRTCKIKLSKTTNLTEKYTYDSRKNLKKITETNGSQTNKNTYNKKKLLTKRVITYKYDGGTSKQTYTYTYKKMKVSSKLASQIKAQQWSLLNENNNYAIPVNNYNGM